MCLARDNCCHIDMYTQLHGLLDQKKAAGVLHLRRKVVQGEGDSS
jgi:hypothetical protein